MMPAVRHGTRRVGERVKGIEPSCPAWEAGVLPLNYTRERRICDCRFSMADLQAANSLPGDDVVVGVGRCLVSAPSQLVLAERPGDDALTDLCRAGSGI